MLIESPLALGSIFVVVATAMPRQWFLIQQARVADSFRQEEGVFLYTTVVDSIMRCGTVVVMANTAVHKTSDRVSFSLKSHGIRFRVFLK
jgi:hypothetical protein